jgi:hypothetical protein
MRKKWMAIVLLLAATILFFPLYPAGADDAAPVDEAADLAQDLTNPLADLMTIPIQMNYDQDIGAGDGGERLRTNIQPVIPFHLNEDWNLISRTIVPVVYQDDIFPGEGSQFGLGDSSLSLFLSPKKPTANGLLWGIGPILLLPTATDSLIGGKKWGAGPTAVVLTMQGPWTTVCWPTMSGPLPATATGRISATPLSSRSCPIPGRAPGPCRSNPKVNTTGKRRSGRCRSMPPYPSWSILASCR